MGEGGREDEHSWKKEHSWKPTSSTQPVSPRQARSPDQGATGRLPKAGSRCPAPTVTHFTDMPKALAVHEGLTAHENRSVSLVPFFTASQVPGCHLGLTKHRAQDTSPTDKRQCDRFPAALTSSSKKRGSLQTAYPVSHESHGHPATGTPPSLPRMGEVGVVAVCSLQLRPATCSSQVLMPREQGNTQHPQDLGSSPHSAAARARREAAFLSLVLSHVTCDIANVKRPQAPGHHDAVALRRWFYPGKKDDSFWERIIDAPQVPTCPKSDKLFRIMQALFLLGQRRLHFELPLCSLVTRASLLL